MANDRLRTAMLAANLTIEQLAERVDAHPKTAERWIRDEVVPHRTTRHRILTVLEAREAEIWPSLDGSGRPLPSETEFVHLYPSRSAITGAGWQELLAGVEEQMDVLVFSGVFLVEQYGLVPIVRRKVQAGVRFRLLVGDEKSEAVLQRAIDEGTPGGLEGRIQLMRRYLAEVTELDGVEVRTHGTTLYNSLYRFDDQLLVNPHVYGALAGQSPVLHFKRHPNGSVWDHYMKSFEQVWRCARPEEGEK